MKIFVRTIVMLTLLVSVSINLGLLAIIEDLEKEQPLSYSERRNIAIDFMAHHSIWRYAMCRNELPPMDSAK